MAKQKTAAKTTRKTAARRELIDPRKDRRYVRRGATGQFKESDDVARSLKRGRQQKAKRKVKSGPGIEATDNVFVFFSNRLGCAGSLLVTVVLSMLLFLLMRGWISPPGAF